MSPRSTGSTVYLPLAILVLCVVVCRTQSPCPSFLSLWLDYDTGQCHGNIQINDYEENDVRDINIHYSYEGKLKLENNYRGSIKTQQSSKPVRYYVHWPVLNILPHIQNITVNGYVVCVGQPARSSETKIRLNLNYKRPAITQQNNQVNSNYVATQQPLLYTRMSYQTSTSTTSTTTPTASPTPTSTTTTTTTTTSAPTSTRSTAKKEWKDSDEWDESSGWSSVPVECEECPKTHKKTSTSTTSTTTTTSTPMDIWFTEGNEENPEHRNDDTCGRVSPDVLLTSLSVNGKQMLKGQFPWIAPLFLRDQSYVPQYICGSTVIAKNYLITAAHCLYEHEILVSHKRLIAAPGLYNIDDFAEENAQISHIAKIISHEDYDESSKVNDVDIAMLRLKRPLRFNDYVVPICLGPKESDISSIVDKVGFVAGWGITENGTTNVPTFVRSAIVDVDDCGENLERVLTRHMKIFCGKAVQAATPCNGDSGSGLVIQYGKHYQLRGVVSKGIVDPNTLKCDVTRHTIYTDVARFREWIEQQLPTGSSLPIVEPRSSSRGTAALLCKHTLYFIMFIFCSCFWM